MAVGVYDLAAGELSSMLSGWNGTVSHKAADYVASVVIFRLLCLRFFKRIVCLVITAILPSIRTIFWGR